jgi:hypothetical protein
VKVRFAAFIQPVELPGKSMANHVHEFLQERAGGFDLNIVEIIGQGFLRISVTDGEFARRRGAWTEDGKPLYGLGRTCYVPLANVRKIELAKDAAEDLAAAKKAKLPAPPPPA